MSHQNYWTCPRCGMNYDCDPKGSGWTDDAYAAQLKAGGGDTTKPPSCVEEPDTDGGALRRGNPPPGDAKTQAPSPGPPTPGSERVAGRHWGDQPPLPGPITSEGMTDERALAVISAWSDGNPWSWELKQALAHLRRRLAEKPAKVSREELEEKIEAAAKMNLDEFMKPGYSYWSFGTDDFINLLRSLGIAVSDSEGKEKHEK